MEIPNTGTVAIIPLRGGSKSIPRKNLKVIAGRPLFHWGTLAACGCPSIDKVYIATDDAEIVESARGIGDPKVEIFNRSDFTATDTAATELVLLELAERKSFDRYVLIQATSPLITTADVCGGIEKIERTGADSLLSVVRQKRFIWAEGADGFAKPVNYDLCRRPRRQEFAGYLVENGAFYISTRASLLRERTTVSGKIAVHEMHEDTYVELDEPVDWIVVEKLIEARFRRG